jgi:hypothetical protein
VPGVSGANPSAAEQVRPLPPPLTAAAAGLAAVAAAPVPEGGQGLLPRLAWEISEAGVATPGRWCFGALAGRYGCGGGVAVGFGDDVRGCVGAVGWRLVVARCCGLDLGPRWAGWAASGAASAAASGTRRGGVGAL